MEKGQRHGSGVQTYADRSKYDGEWVRDAPIRNERIKLLNQLCF